MVRLFFPPDSAFLVNAPSPRLWGLPVRRRSILIVFSVQLAALHSANGQSFDEFSERRSPSHFRLQSGDLSLTLKGEVELELHDLQGSGGATHDSPTDTRTLGTRSPFVEIDAFWLALRFAFADQLAINSILEFDQSGARIGAVYFSGKLRWPERLEHRFEAGLHTPFVKVERRTERYPLIGTIYWRHPEFHITYNARLRLARETGIALGVSVAIMRPLAFLPVQESSSQQGTINLLGYGPARFFSGNGPVYGARFHAHTHGAYATLFGFLGSLSAEAGTDELRNNFSRFQDLPGYNSEDKQQQDTTFYWAGLRTGYDGYGFHFLAEAIFSRESLLQRQGFYAQLSYELELRPEKKLFCTIELLTRYERYRLKDTTVVLDDDGALRSPAPSEAITWDYDIATAALIVTIYRQLLRLRFEYYWVGEANGVPALGIANSPLKNDELLVQLELRF
jgi:hypothetical protein